MLTECKEEKRRKRHLRIRKKVLGTPERPRLSLHRSHLNLEAQVIDDLSERTLFSLSTLKPEIQKSGRKAWGDIEAARQFALIVSGELKQRNLKRIAFDRSGLPYHGRVRSFADSLRENGIEF
jgi:large subunit ribosomal protein L18